VTFLLPDHTKAYSIQCTAGGTDGKDGDTGKDEQHIQDHQIRKTGQRLHNF